ncbi:MAG TPA: TolC family protein [Acidisarcina sp.]|nr:TolC family protein [Acidisarcina sp.]
MALALLACNSIPVLAQTVASGAGSSASPYGVAAQSTAVPSQGSTSPFQGSVVEGQATAGVLSLSLDEAIQRGLRQNLGIILSGTSQQAAAGQRLQELQALLPTVNGSLKEAVMQTDLQAQGLRIPGFPAIVGPFGYTDLRGALSWSLVNVASLQNYLAAKHNFAGTRLSAQDARDMVTLTVGNAYLLVISDAARIRSVQAQVDTARVSLDQAVANHQAGTAPLLDELRARVDYQTLQQSLITSQNQFAKDKIALARVIGLPLDQKFELTDQAPYAALDTLDVDSAVKQALIGRKDLQALEEQVKSAEKQRSAATAERYPTLGFQGDYGDIGVNLAKSHGTGDAVGTLSFPIFAEPKLRGDAQLAQSQLNQRRAQLNDMRGQINADVRDSILDIQAAVKQVEVAHSNVLLATEALSEAQQRYAAGVSDNLAVTQAQQSVAQANDQYVSSLYQHNVAKLALARALGVAHTNYKDYVGGK